jgi:hypothetical protein
VTLQFSPASQAGGAWRAQVIDRSRRAAGTFFDAATLRGIPNGSGLWGMLDAAAPFVIVDRLDGGGVGLGAPARAGSRGASWTTTRLSLGDLQVADHPAGSDRVASVPDLRDFEALSIASGLATPDIATPGAAITLVPRRPGSERRGAVDASITTPGMVADPNAAKAPPIDRLDTWKAAHVEFGGPVTRRLGVFASGSSRAASEWERDLSEPRRSSVVSAFAHAIANPTVRTQFRVLGAAERVRRPYFPVQVLGNAGTERDLFLNGQVSWEHQTAAGARVQAEIGVQRGAFTPTTGADRTVLWDRVTDGPIPSPVDHQITTRSDGRILFAPPPIAGHAIEVGLSLAGSRARTMNLSSPPIAELVGGLPARIWLTTPGTNSRRTINDVAAYFNDRIRPRSDVTMNAGIRLEQSRGSSADQPGVTWRGVLPRLAVRWAPRLLTLFAGYGQYQQEMPLAMLAFGDPGESVREVHRWIDANADGQFAAGEIGELVALAGRGAPIASIDPALRAPRTHEFTFGAERRLGADMLVSVAGTVRRERSLVRSVDVGVSASDFVVVDVPDPGVDYDSPSDDRLLATFERLPESFGSDRYLLTNVPGDTTSYDGLEIAWRVTRPRWWGLAGASAIRTSGAGGNRGFRSNENDQGVIGELLENPNADVHEAGRLFFDRAYVLKLASGYEAPHDVSVAVSARYQDGQPFSRLVIASDLAQGPEIVPAYPNGRTRFTFTATVDARIEKRFRVHDRTAAVGVEIYNLPNLGLEVEENALTGPAFRQTSAVQPPRAVRVRFHLEF